MRKYISYTFSLLLLCTTLSLQAQTQEEIEQMLNESTETTEKDKKEKKEKIKKEKEVKEKAENEIQVMEETLEEKVAKTIKEVTESTEDKVVKTKKIPTEENTTDELASQKPKKLIKIGNALMKDGSHYNALDYYEAALMNTKKKTQEL